jgi:regulator of protease activity HflC (stomatin/prohibitin superfamily)
MRPGFRLIIPFVETIQVVDIRVITINIVSQVMTEDNVPCSIDGVVFFRVNDQKTLKVEKFNFAITQLAKLL